MTAMKPTTKEDVIARLRPIYERAVQDRSGVTFALSIEEQALIDEADIERIKEETGYQGKHTDYSAFSLSDAQVAALRGTNIGHSDENKVPFKFNFHEGDVGHKLIIGPTRTGMSTRFNPVGMVKDDPEFVMSLLEQMAALDINQEIRAQAKEIVLAEAEAKDDLNLIDVVNAFDQVPELKLFAAQLRKFALPGAFGKLFD